MLPFIGFRNIGSNQSILVKKKNKTIIFIQKTFSYKSSSIYLDSEIFDGNESSLI